MYNSEFRTAFTFKFVMMKINYKKGGFIRFDVHSANIVMHTALTCPPYSLYPYNKGKLENPKYLTTQMPKLFAGTDQTCCLLFMVVINYLL
jgi:hypothetical protein